MLNGRCRHGASQLIMKGWSAVGKRRHGGIALEPQAVFDTQPDLTSRQPVSEDVGSDLTDGAFEKQQVEVVKLARGAFA